MVMLLGIALTFILGSLITQGVTDKTTLSERAASFSAQQQLQFAQDHAIHSLLEEVNDNGFVNAVSTAIPSCFSQYDTDTTRMLVATTSVSDDSADYIVRQLSRSGHALALGNNTNQLNLQSFGETGYEGNLSIDMWFKITDNDALDLIVSSDNTALVTLTSNGENATVRIFDNASLSSNLNVDEWYYLLFQVDDTSFKLRVGQQTISTPITTSTDHTNQFSQGDWVIGRGSGDIELATLRAWRDYSNFDLDDQFIADKDFPGKTTQSPETALFFDASTDTDLNSLWTLPIGRASVNTANTTPFDLDYAEDAAVTARYAPPAPREVFQFDGCSSDVQEQQRIVIERDATRGVFTWDK